MRRGAAVLLVALLGVGHLRGQEPSTIFYRARPYGSEAAFTPLAAIIASAYYDFQLNNRGDDPFALPYGAGARNLMANLTSPLAAIGEYGWGRFLTTEILPVPIPSHGQWVPNYIGHLIG